MTYIQIMLILIDNSSKHIMYIIYTKLSIVFLYTGLNIILHYLSSVLILSLLQLSGVPDL